MRTFDPEMELAIFILVLWVTKFSPLMENLFILHWESKSMLLRMLGCFLRSFYATLSSTPNHFHEVRLRRHFSAPFLFFCLCLLSNVCLSPLIIYFISTSYVLFSASMLIFIFVLWLFLSHIINFLLVHYTELRLRLVYQSLPIQRTPFTCPNAFADELVICSLNVRGLSNTMKRREIFRWLKTKKYAVFFPQEVHCSKDKEMCWRMGVFSYIN